jgi:hypothetical protein
MVFEGDVFGRGVDGWHLFDFRRNFAIMVGAGFGVSWLFLAVPVPQQALT